MTWYSDAKSASRIYRRTLVKPHVMMVDGKMQMLISYGTQTDFSFDYEHRADATEDWVRRWNARQQDRARMKSPWFRAWDDVS